MVNKEQDIQIILEFINKELENNIPNHNFIFFHYDKNKNIFVNSLGYTYEYLQYLLNICEKREFIIIKNFITGGFDKITLTSLGKYQALNHPNNLTSNTLNIETIITKGHTQIGNHNIQNISDDNPINKISNSSVSILENEYNKSMVRRLIKHPLFCTIIGVVITSIITMLIR